MENMKSHFEKLTIEDSQKRDDLCSPGMFYEQLSACPPSSFGTESF